MLAREENGRKRAKERKREEKGIDGAKEGWRVYQPYPRNILYVQLHKYFVNRG